GKSTNDVEIEAEAFVTGECFAGELEQDAGVFELGHGLVLRTGVRCGGLRSYLRPAACRRPTIAVDAPPSPASHPLRGWSFNTTTNTANQWQCPGVPDDPSLVKEFGAPRHSPLTFLI